MPTSNPESHFSSIKALVDLLSDLPGSVKGFKTELERFKQDSETVISELNKRYDEEKARVDAKIKQERRTAQETLNILSNEVMIKRASVSSEISSLEAKRNDLATRLQTEKDSYEKQSTEMNSDLATLRKEKQATIKELDSQIIAKEVQLKTIQGYINEVVSAAN